MVAKAYLAQALRQGMNHYWKVVYSPTDKGLDAIEIRWKRDHERDMARWAERYLIAFLVKERSKWQLTIPES